MKCQIEYVQNESDRTNLLLLLLLLEVTSCTSLAFKDLLLVHPDDEGDEPGALVRGRIAGGDALSPGGQVVDDELADDLRVRAEWDSWPVSPLLKNFFVSE